jgi:hypothetical protein
MSHHGALAPKILPAPSSQIVPIQIDACGVRSISIVLHVVIQDAGIKEQESEEDSRLPR